MVYEESLRRGLDAAPGFAGIVTRVRKVLLLNPPGRLRYIRDQYCSHVSKGRYYWQPLDLLLLSGQLRADGFEVAVVDAIAEGLPVAAAARRVAAIAPDAVIFLTGSDSFEEDVRFVATIKQRGVRVAVGIGDILRDRGAVLLERHPVVDACLNDFVTHGLGRFLEGRLEEAGNMTVRTPAGIRAIAAPPRAERFTLPVPQYGLFPLRRYRMPFNRHHPYATVIASSGCPFACRFCPFARTAFRLREVDDVLAHLEAIRRLGIRQVHFADWTFGVVRQHTTALLEGMIAARFGFTWSCLSRVDLVDREMLALFVEAGADLVEFGVESGSQAILDRYRKQITVGQVRTAFRHCSDFGLSTLATFVLGLPGETPQSLQETLDLALEIEPTFCSFNVASPRMGTPWRRELVGAGLLDADATSALDSSWSAPVVSPEQPPAAALERFRRHAIRRFYGRPSYLLGRIRQLRSLEELLTQAGNGFSLAWQNLRSLHE
jgi:hypothetical protein